MSGNREQHFILAAETKPG